ncbi:hypothetical protein [Streptacidiphilus sp. EB103A]|uniref:hypothetical protein n=1 Tax=Streptacidiphilus sp. EB103A TaxID=3156275 RepID=UPI0035198F86
MQTGRPVARFDGDAQGYGTALIDGGVRYADQAQSVGELELLGSHLCRADVVAIADS